jgi:hypothetical protein
MQFLHLFRGNEVQRHLIGTPRPSYGCSAGVRRLLNLVGMSDIMPLPSVGVFASCRYCAADLAGRAGGSEKGLPPSA